MPGEMKLAALASVRRGFRVFPCHPLTKVAAVGGLNAKRRPDDPRVALSYSKWATVDEDLINEWWDLHPDHNPTISTDGMVVVDIDVKDGKPGLASFKALGLPGTFTVRTPSGGFHAYYEGQASNSVEEIAPGLDIRSLGGLVPAPGARTKDGVYRIVDGGDRPVQPLPAKLAELLHAPRTRDAAAAQTPSVPINSDASLQRAISWLRNEAPVAVEDQRSDIVTYKVAARLKDMGVNVFDACGIMLDDWAPRCSFHSEEAAQSWIETKVQNAYAYGVRNFGADAPEVQFAGMTPILPPRVASTLSWNYHGEAPDLEDQWLFHKILPSIGTCLIVGATQTGKTFLITFISAAITGRGSLFGVPTDLPGAVICLYAGTEGSGIRNRLAALGVEDAHLPIAYTHIPNLRPAGAVEALAKEVKAQAAYMLEAFGVPVRAIVLETVSASGLVDEENNSADVAAAIRTLGIIGRECNALFITSHHPSKSGSDPRGSGAWTANVDCEIQISREGKSQVRVVELTKIRNASQRVLGSFTLEEVILGEDSKGREVTSMRLSTSEGVGLAKKAVAREHTDIFFDTLDQVPEASWSVTKDGSRVVSKAELKALFCIRKLGGNKAPGAKSNANRAFENALQAAEDQGIVKSLALRGEAYITRGVYT